MSKTKRAQKVRVRWHKTTGEYASYRCPACQTEFVGADVTKATVRFRCGCGQVLDILEAAE